MSTSGEEEEDRNNEKKKKDQPSTTDEKEGGDLYSVFLDNVQTTSTTTTTPPPLIFAMTEDEELLFNDPSGPQRLSREDLAFLTTHLLDPMKRILKVQTDFEESYKPFRKPQQSKEKRGETPKTIEGQSNAFFGALSKELSVLLTSAESALVSSSSSSSSSDAEPGTAKRTGPVSQQKEAKKRYEVKCKRLLRYRNMILRQTFAYLCELSDWGRNRRSRNTVTYLGSRTRRLKEWLMLMVEMKVVFPFEADQDKNGPFYERDFLYLFDPSSLSTAPEAPDVSNGLLNEDTTDRRTTRTNFITPDAYADAKTSLSNTMNDQFIELYDEASIETFILHLMVRIKKMNVYLVEALKNHENHSMDTVGFWKSMLKSINMAKMAGFEIIGSELKYFASLLTRVGYEAPPSSSMSAEYYSQKNLIHSKPCITSLLNEEY